MSTEKPLYGLTAELYRAVVSLIDDRMSEIRVVREDFDRLTATVQALAEAQRRTEERVNELAEAQRRTEEQVQALTREVQALTREMFIVKTDIKGLKDDMGSVKGRLLEMDYREKASSYFGRLLRRVRVLPLVEWLDELEAHLSPEEVDEVWRLDLVVGGVLKEGPEVWLAIEVSSVMDRNDVGRAARRAELLRRLGRPVVAVVAGEDMTEGGVEEAQARRVALFRDGQPYFWQEALQVALGREGGGEF